MPCLLCCNVCADTFYWISSHTHTPQVFSLGHLYVVPRWGVRHLATWQCNKTLFADRHAFQEEPQVSNEDSDGEEGNHNELEGIKVDNTSEESTDEDNGIGEENDNMLIVAVTNLDILAAAGIDFS